MCVCARNVSMYRIGTVRVCTHAQELQHCLLYYIVCWWALHLYVTVRLSLVLPHAVVQCTVHSLTSSFHQPVQLIVSFIKHIPLQVLFTFN